MNSFIQLFSDTHDIYDDELKDYFTDFFTSEKFDEYLIEDLATKKDIKSIKKMFESKEDIVLRALNVIDEDPYCLEANYVLYGVGPDDVVGSHFIEMYKKKDSYNDLSDYQKKVYLWILHFYGEYLLDIHSIKKAINVVNTRIELMGVPNPVDLDRLSYMYCLLEDDKNFLKLYKTHGFFEPLPYLLLISVLLKNDKEEKAKEFFFKLLKNYKYATYIDHLWDIESSEDEEAIIFFNAVEQAFEELCSVPNFFEWCSKTKSELYRS